MPSVGKAQGENVRVLELKPQPDRPPLPRGQVRGLLPFHDGRTSSELSIGVNIGGKEMEIPSLVPTLSPDEIRTAMQRLVQDESLRQRCIEAGWQRVEKLTWQATAEQTAAVYRAALAGR